MFDFITRLFKKPQEKKAWETVYSLKPFFTDINTGKVIKQWVVHLQVRDDEHRVLGLDDLDTEGHPCYNALIVPWLTGYDYVVLGDGTLFQFEKEIHMTGLTEDGFLQFDEMNMDELESLANNLINNKQKNTVQGVFAQEYGMMLLSQISSSGEFVEQYFKKDK